jgi:hypothetical protein
LKKFAEIVQSKKRDYDIFGRFGGRNSSLSFLEQPKRIFLKYWRVSGSPLRRSLLGMSILRLPVASVAVVLVITKRSI